MLVVAYIYVPHPSRICEREDCPARASVTAICADGDLVEHLCGDHAAEHMRGNAYALAGAGEPSVRQAEIFNELDAFREGDEL